VTTDDRAFDPFAGGGILLTVPTTDPQQEIWLATRLGGASANLAYNESLSLRLRGPLDVPALNAALRDMAARHEALRATFTNDGETLCIDAAPRGELVVDDLGGLAGEPREERRRAIEAQEVMTPFDLAHGPLFRSRLIRLGDDEHELVLTAHHLVCDGWSAGVLVSELPELYQARRAGRSAGLEPAPRFSDYALADRRASQGEEAAEAEQYWLGVLGKAPPALDLPTDRPRPMQRNLAAAREDWLIGEDLTKAMRSTARSLGCSLAALLLASLDALVYRLTGQSDFVIAMPAAGQAAAGLDRLVGHCVNTLPLRLAFDPKAPFGDHVKAVKRAIIDGFEHQRLSLGGLLRKLDLPRDPSRVPLSPVIFNLDRSMPATALGEAAVTIRTNGRAFEHFELFFNAAEADDGIALELTYSTGIFDRETIRRWLSEFTELLRGVVADPATPLCRLPVLTPEERERLVDAWNQTELALPGEPTVLELVEAQVRKSPNAIAVRDAHTSLTYAELDGHANSLAHELRDLGVKRDDCVGVCVERSTRLLTALLAVWKAGAAYVPLDPAYPATRLDFVAQDASLRVLVTETSLRHVLPRPEIHRVLVDRDLGTRGDPPPREADPRQLAYVLHTSGSTGQPKGVQIEQRSFVNLLLSIRRWPGISPADVVVAVTTLSFDIAGLELFLPLVVGAQVVMATREAAMDAELLGDLLKASGATLLQATPATWRFLVESGWRPGTGLRAFIGGEALMPDLAKELLSRVGELYNLYGPTETTIYSTGTRIESGEAITIGRPIANTTAYILDDMRELVPTGARGELYIGGIGVARGYLNRPDLTQERFVPDPFSNVPGARMYRTGDLARYDASGKIVYEGRNDGQVKLRGFRIELGEVESCLSQHPAVRQSVAMVHDFGPGDRRLVAYVVSADGSSVDTAALQNHVRSALPPYMVPQHVVPLAQMPLTPNGKIDRKALPLPDAGSENVEEYVAPGTNVQKRLAEIWADMLRVRRVGIRDGFFDLGGHSMLVVRMLNLVGEAFGVDLPMRTVFEAQTIEALSARIEAALLLANGGKAKALGGATGEKLEEVEF
jgi:amino acid adenylation domain-containing protein